MFLELPCLPQSVPVIRAAVAQMAREVPFTPTEVDDVVMAAGEAAANAVRHGVPAERDGVLRMHCASDGACFTLEITDSGDGFDPSRVPAPDIRAYREGGLGIYLMRRVMDEVTFTFDARGTTVRLVKSALLSEPGAAETDGCRQETAVGAAK